MKASGTREYLFEALQSSAQTSQLRGLKAFFRRLPWATSQRRTRRALADISFSGNSYLATSGWLRSRRDKAAVDRSGQPLPWFTYPSVQFIATRIGRGLSVFEYGSGASTLWWAARVRTVVSCGKLMHDRFWTATSDSISSS